jgi:hypothetical protein
VRGRLELESSFKVRARPSRALCFWGEHAFHGCTLAALIETALRPSATGWARFRPSFGWGGTAAANNSSQPWLPNENLYSSRCPHALRLHRHPSAGRSARGHAWSFSRNNRATGGWKLCRSSRPGGSASGSSGGACCIPAITARSSRCICGCWTSQCCRPTVQPPIRLGRVPIPRTPWKLQGENNYGVIS